MPRKSSIHFKPLTNIRFAVSHSERTDLSEPAYLLPKEHQLGNIVVAGSFSENDLAALFIKQKEGMTGQAKARASSPFWEGVVVLPNTNSQEQSTNLQAWKNAYEKETGHKVLHMSVHLDEGYLDALGKPQYNPHAHVIVSRMDEKNRVISLGRKQLANVQDLTAGQLKMERGSTLTEREGKRGRKHIPHKEFRHQADEKRLQLALKESAITTYERLVDAQNAHTEDQKETLKNFHLEASKVLQMQADLDALARQITQLKEQYRLDREALKASGEAKQADYQSLKKVHEKALEELTATKAQAAKVPDLVEQLRVSQEQRAKAQTQAAKVPNLEEQAAKATKQLSEAQTLIGQYQRDRAVLKASGEAKQADHQTLKIAHETALKYLENSKRNMTAMDEYSKKLKAALVKSDEKIATELIAKAKVIEDLVQAGVKSDSLLITSNGHRDAARQLMEKLAISDEKVETLTAENTAGKANVPSLASLVRASYVKFVEWITGNSGKRIEINTQSSDHCGPVLQLDDLHALQRVGIDKFAIHQLAHLDKVPRLDDPKMEIKYRGGFGQVIGNLGQGVGR